MHRRILVPLDGSAAAEAVLPHAVRVLDPASGELILLGVVDPKPLQDPRLLPELEAQVREYLSGVRNGQGDSARIIRVLVLTGSPPDVILKTARAEGVSLIAMTTHGRSGIQRILMGSVAESVLRSAEIPILILPAR